MSDTIIKVENISKRYRIGLQEKKADTFALQLWNNFKAPIENFKRIKSLGKFEDESESIHWALNDVSFEVKQGEVLGIIGKNGAGKSTLLKVLSKITEPTSGRIELNGRVAALLEVGTGFHPELTGRENIYMNGTILGMTKKEIDRKLDEIIDFSGVEKYVDTPVKFYSSGMRVRLGFSVAAHLDPEILIIDEVLAVGDFEFQKRCLGKMEEVAGGGRTVLFVSHNMGAVKELCHNALILEKGKVVKYGTSELMVANYYNRDQTIEIGKPKVEDYHQRTFKGSEVLIHDIKFKEFGENIPVIPMHSNLELILVVESKIEFRGANFNFRIGNEEGLNLGGRFSLDDGFKVDLYPGINEFSVNLFEIPLSQGKYFITFGVNQSENTIAWDIIKDYPLFEIINDNQFNFFENRPWGINHFKVDWKKVDKNESIYGIEQDKRIL